MTTIFSIDGHVDGWFSDDTAERFEAYGWQVIRNVDGHDAEQIRAATILAQAEKEKPTLIICKPSSDFGSPINLVLMIAMVHH